MSTADYLKRYLSGDDGGNASSDYIQPAKKKKKKPKTGAQPAKVGGFKLVDTDLENTVAAHVSEDSEPEGP